MPHQSEPLSWPHVPLASTPCHAALWVNVFFCFFVAPNVLLYHYNDVCQNGIQKKAGIPFFSNKNNQKNFDYNEPSTENEAILWKTPVPWQKDVFSDKKMCSLTKSSAKKHLFYEFLLPVNPLFGQIESAAASNTSFPQLSTSIAGATLELNFPSSSDWY